MRTSYILHRTTLAVSLWMIGYTCFSQLKWQNVDSLFQPLPASVHIYFTNQQIDTGVFRAYYLVADLKNKKLEFTADTAKDRRLTPAVFYERDNHPLVVVNCTFFSYETNHSLNAVIKDGKLVAFNQAAIYGRGKDTFTYRHPLGSALGISAGREASIAWLYTDSIKKRAYFTTRPFNAIKDSSLWLSRHDISQQMFLTDSANSHLIHPDFRRWKMRTAVGGGPVLLQNGEIHISNNEEVKFTGKAINDKHPRTAMGYTRNGKLIILMIEGRNPIAHGATLGQEAQILKDLGCWEALNLDGGGSSCMLVNGKETIKPSEHVERPAPAMFIIKVKR